MNQALGVRWLESSVERYRACLAEAGRFVLSWATTPLMVDDQQVMERKLDMARLFYEEAEFCGLMAFTMSQQGLAYSFQLDPERVLIRWPRPWPWLTIETWIGNLGGYRQGRRPAMVAIAPFGPKILQSEASPRFSDSRLWFLRIGTAPRRTIESVRACLGGAGLDRPLPPIGWTLRQLVELELEAAELLSCELAKRGLVY